MNFITRYNLARDRKVTVANLVDELLRRKGDCVVSVDETGPFHLSELHSIVCSLDAFLRRRVGLQPGQPVAIYRTNDKRCFQWFLAILRAGGIAVPLNPQLSLAEVRRILADSGTEIVVTDKAVFERNIVARDALDVGDLDRGRRRWSDDGRIPFELAMPARRFRPQPSIRQPPSPSFIPPAPADSPREQPSQAARCSARAPPPCSQVLSWGRRTLRWSRCPGRTSWR